VGDVVNHFVHASAAARYAAGRPFFHPMVIERIVRVTRSPRFARGLDVACGTGQSARALAQICDSVDAIDISVDMLTCAEASDRVTYLQASAEALPFGDGLFDLATVGLAFHWFDQEQFLSEARRVLKAGGWLGIYNNGFSGEMAENADFRKWAWEDYPKRFPSPARKGWGVTRESVKPLGFDLIAEEPFENPTLMTRKQLVDYLLTQTNVIAAVENGSMEIKEAAKWIDDGIIPFFASELRTMRFSGRVWMMKKL
jgi:SAM-dependent methyltransferase